MPAITRTSTARTVTPRQRLFIAALAAERTVPVALQADVAHAEDGTLSSRRASELIGQLMDTPRANDTRRSQDRVSGGQRVDTPNDAYRAGRMLNAGGIEATVTLVNGEHVTLQVRSRKPQGRGWTNCAPTDEGARINLRANGNKIGWVTLEQGQWIVHFRTRSIPARQAVTALFEYAAGRISVGGMQVREASRCGRCMRALTDPVSIDRGIGPECFGRSTGSRAASIGESPVQTPDAIAEARMEAHDRAFAQAEREAGLAAVEDLASSLGLAADAMTTPAPLPLTTLAADAASPVLTREKRRARDLIAEALDAYCSDADRDFAMRTFDQLAAR